MEKQFTPTKRRILNLYVEPEEKETFQAVAKARGLSVSGLIRLLVLDEARRLDIVS